MAVCIVWDVDLDVDVNKECECISFMCASLFFCYIHSHNVGEIVFHLHESHAYATLYT